MSKLQIDVLPFALVLLCLAIILYWGCSKDETLRQCEDRCSDDLDRCLSAAADSTDSTACESDHFVGLEQCRKKHGSGGKFAMQEIDLKSSRNS